MELPEKVQITSECEEVLRGLLMKEPRKRVPWRALFAHKFVGLSEENRSANVSLLPNFAVQFREGGREGEGERERERGGERGKEREKRGVFRRSLTSPSFGEAEREREGYAEDIERMSHTLKVREHTHTKTTENDRERERERERETHTHTKRDTKREYREKNESFNEEFVDSSEFEIGLALATLGELTEHGGLGKDERTK